MDPQVIAAGHAQPLGDPGRLSSAYERLLDLPRMRHFGILACLLYLLAPAPSVKAQILPIGTEIVTNTMFVYLTAVEYKTLATSIDAIKYTIADHGTLLNNAMNAQTVELSKRYVELREVQGQLLNIMGGISASHQDFVIHSKLAADSIKNMDLEFSLMRPIFTDLRMYLAAFGPKVGELNVSMQGLTTSMNNVGSTVSSAVALAGVNTANQFINTMGPKLDAIRNALMSNGMGTNNISITSTNGDITLTNDIKITIPSMDTLNTFAEKSMNKGDTVEGFAKLVPSDYWEARQTADWASPWQWLSLPSAPSVAAGSVPGNFMSITVPNGSGGVWTWDANPMTHAPGLVNGFRTGMAWATLLALLFFCGKVAQEATLNMGAANQTHSPNIAVLGNNTGLGIGIGYVALFVVAAGAFATAMGNAIDIALFSELALNPFRDFGADALILANMFLPIGLMVAASIWSLTARWLLVAESWLFNFFIRILPA